MTEDDWNTRVGRPFAWMLAAALTLAGAWCLFRLDSALLAAIVWCAAALIALAGWLKSDAVGLIYEAWVCVTFPLAWLISHLLLAGVYYLIITPIGLLLRCLGHDPLNLRRKPSAESYWTPRKPVEDQRRYFRQF